MRRTTRGLGGRTVLTGSQWWTLTADAARWVLAVTDTDQALVRFMRHTRIPDEHYVQTLLGNSIFRWTVQPPVLYADWRPTDGHLPAILTTEHLDELVGGPYLWARKFPDDSGRLVAALQRRLALRPQPGPVVDAVDGEPRVSQGGGRRS